MAILHAESQGLGMDNEFPISIDDIRLRRELIRSGWRDRDIAHAVKSGLISRVRYGAYADAQLWNRLDERGRHRARARAVLKTGHPSSVLSHQSSLAELDVPLWRLCLDEVALTRTDGISGRRERGIVQHSGALHLEHLTMRHGVPISTAPRVAIEMLTTTDLELGFCLLNALLHLGRTTIEEVKGVAAQTEHWPNTLSVRIAIGLADSRLSSIAESRFVYLCYRENVPIPEPQVEIRAAGRLLGVIDFLWRKHGVFLEFDGRIKYLIHRRPNESLEDYVIREKHREERICQATGWICIRITWADLESPTATARRILAILAKRQPAAS